jgi:hypothetical protein
MKTTKIFFATFTLGVLLTACWGSKHATSQKQSSGKADTTAITNVVRKDTATVDSLTWYTGPIDTFENWEAYKAYLKRERNIIREKPLGNFASDLYIRMPDGTVQFTSDIGRATYQTKISNDEVPVFLKKLLPDAEFYYSKLNSDKDPNDLRPEPSVLLCRINNNNFDMLPDINIIFDSIYHRKITIEEKIEYIISLIKGLRTNYKIISIQSNTIISSSDNPSYEVIYVIENKKYYGYLYFTKNNEICRLVIKNEAGKFLESLEFNSKFYY